MLSALRCECVVAVSYCSTLYNYLTTLFLFKANEHVGCSLATYLSIYGVVIPMHVLYWPPSLAATTAHSRCRMSHADGRHLLSLSALS